MSFANPYNFVSIDEKKITREKNWLSQEKFNGHNGKFICTIKFLSNFITAGIEKKQLQIKGKPAIQASSLKGLLRATVEAISNSCISLMSDSYKYRTLTYSSPISKVKYEIVCEDKKQKIKFDHKSLVDENALIDSCDEKNGLCIACRLFGTSAKENKETEETFTYKGKIRLSDAIIEGNPKFTTKYLKSFALSNPKNHHEKFYLKNGNKIKGRKFYYHHKNDNLLKQEDTTKVELLNKDSVFQFSITFENLTDEEYGLLLWTLELEPGLGHKIGMGKPLGLGSCIIEVTEIKEINKNHYLSLEDNGKIYNESNGNLKSYKETIKKYWTKGIPQDLKCILTLDNGFTIKYPTRGSNEFNNPLHLPCEDFSGKKIKSPSIITSPCNPRPKIQDLSKHKGKVKNFMTNSFGFISPEKGNKDIFVHQNTLNNCGIKTLVKGDWVEFGIEETEKGLQAVNLKIINKKE